MSIFYDDSDNILSELKSHNNKMRVKNYKYNTYKPRSSILVPSTEISMRPLNVKNTVLDVSNNMYDIINEFKEINTPRHPIYKKYDTTPFDVSETAEIFNRF